MTVHFSTRPLRFGWLEGGNFGMILTTQSPQQMSLTPPNRLFLSTKEGRRKRSMNTNWIIESIFLLKVLKIYFITSKYFI